MNYGSTALGGRGPCNISVEPFYDNRVSSTATPEVFLDFGNGYGSYTKIVYGNSTINDTITFQSSAGQTSTIGNVRTVLADFMTQRLPARSDCPVIPFDKSIMGIMAYNPLTARVNIRQDLLENGLIEAPVISLWFDKTPDDAKVDATFTGGTTFGAIDSSKYTGPLVKVPWLKPEGNSPFFYQVPPPTATTLDGQSVFAPYSSSDVECLVDSGTQVDTLPVSDELLLAAGLTKTSLGSIAHPGPCESIPRNKTLDLTFAGATNGTSVTIKVPLRNYARGYADLTNTDYCQLNLESSTVSCLVGATFASAAFFAADDAKDEIALAQGGVSEKGSGVDESALRRDLADAV